MTEDLEPMESLGFASITSFRLEFRCHQKQMECFKSDALNFYLKCDLCGKRIDGAVIQERINE